MEQCKCGGQLNYYSDYGVEYLYCSKCLQAYDVETYEPIPYREPTDYGEEC